MAKPDNELLQALSACVVHARDLVEAAKAVQSTGRSNIAYHLATLALEEMGKRELYGIQAAATAVGEPPKWQISRYRRSQNQIVLVLLRVWADTRHS